MRFYHKYEGTRGTYSYHILELPCGRRTVNAKGRGSLLLAAPTSPLTPAEADSTLKAMNELIPIDRIGGIVSSVIVMISNAQRRAYGEIMCQNLQISFFPVLFFWPRSSRNKPKHNLLHIGRPARIQKLPAPEAMAVGGAERLGSGRWGCGVDCPVAVVTNAIQIPGAQPGGYQ